MSFHVQNGMHPEPKVEDLSPKMFIGQVPRTWEESDLRPLLEEFGEVHDIQILRDKYTGQHKGEKIILKFVVLMEATGGLCTRKQVICDERLFDRRHPDTNCPHIQKSCFPTPKCNC